MWIPKLFQGKFDNGFIFSNIIKECISSMIEYSAAFAPDISPNSLVLDLIGTIDYNISFSRNTINLQS
jgi:hypothetical protein